MAMTDKERQKVRREKLKAEGKKQIVVTLDADVQKILHDKCGKEGLTYSQGVNEFLRESSPAKPPTATGDEKAFRDTYHAFLKEVRAAGENNWESVSYWVACDLIGDLNKYI